MSHPILNVGPDEAFKKQVESISNTAKMLPEHIKLLKKVDLDRFRERVIELGEALLKVGDGSFESGNVFTLKHINGTGGTNQFPLCFDFTDSGFDLFIALWAILGKDFIVDDAHRKLLVDRLLGDVNPTAGSSSGGAL